MKSPSVSWRRFGAIAGMALLAACARSWSRARRAAPAAQGSSARSRSMFDRAHGITWWQCAPTSSPRISTSEWTTKSPWAGARLRRRPSRMPSPLLEVDNLQVEFAGRRGRLVALDGVSFSIAPGEILGVVGESGAGKSLTGAAIIGLLDPPGRISGGQVLLEGQRIDNLPYEQMRHIRGRKIGAIFQDPLTSLNPLYTIGHQLTETIQTHLPMNAAQARARAIELLGEVGIPAPERRIDHYP